MEAATHEFKRVNGWCMKASDCRSADVVEALPLLEIVKLQQQAIVSLEEKYMSSQEAVKSSMSVMEGKIDSILDILLR
jgi:hypothetical protein